MLCLTRNKGQSVEVGPECRLTVQHVRNRAATIELARTGPRRETMTIDLPLDGFVRIDGLGRIGLLKLRMGQAMLGFDCPRELSIYRSELGPAAQ